MTKQDFIERLRRYLSGTLDHRQVNEHIRYYTEYIEAQIRQGRTEEEVMAALGDPRLIARTLTEVEEADGRNNGFREEFIEEEEQPDPRSHKLHFKGKTLQIPKWVFNVILGLVAFVIVVLVFTVISWLLPYVLLIFGVIMVYRFLRKTFKW